jgi:Fic family protein
MSDSPARSSDKIVRQSKGYNAFIPLPLPPAIPMETELVRLISEADLSLGRLNGLASIIDDPDLFVYLYVRKEALLSSQIEGTQCSLEDVLTGDAGQTGKNLDVEEVSNYVSALNKGLKKIKTFPVSNRLIRELHAIVLQGTRGASRRPGELRTTQNWIGRPGADITQADFVPPPPNEVQNCLAELEKYIDRDDGLPVLVRAALIHAQFETIHPFLDGNGRLGRLLITLLLCHWGVIDKPLVYLSYFFKANRTEYYARLMAVRQKSDWINWLKFFLRGVAETAKMANSAAIEIHQLHIRDRERIHDAKAGHTAIKLFSVLSKSPTVGIPKLCALLNKPAPTVQRAVDHLVKLKILREVSGQARNRRYVYSKYLDILRRDTATEIG